MTARLLVAVQVLALLILLSPVRAADPPAQPKSLLAWGKRGDKPGEFYSPIQIAISKRDEIYIADLNNGRIQKFDTDGKYLGGFDLLPDKLPRKGCGIGGMALAEDDGNELLLYLSFMNQNRIGVFTETGKLVRDWGRKGNSPAGWAGGYQRGKGDGEFDQPGGIVLISDGTLFVTDQCNHRVQKFTRAGKFLAKWGEYGGKPGQFGAPEPAGSRFAGPHFLARDSKGRLYTTEGVLGRVQQLSPEGRPLAAWGDKGDQPGGFRAYANRPPQRSFGPIGIMVDKYDRVWVSSLNDRVQMFTPEGKFVLGLGSKQGNGPGEFHRPHGMAMDSHGNLYVVDASNQRIQKFAVPSP